MLCAVVLGLIALLVLPVVVRWLRRKQLQGNCLAGQRVLITGASSGIGEECAYRYARHGAHVVLAARRVDRLRGVQKRCTELALNKDQQFFVVGKDVSVEGECRALVEESIKLLGGIDVLVLNAGAGVGNLPFASQQNLEAYRGVFELNYWGCLWLTQYALPSLKENHGTIIAISSMAAIFPTANRCGYAPTKAALNAFCHCLRRELRDTVSVCIIEPGYVVSEIHNKIIERDGVKRNMSKFRSTEEAATLIVTAGYNREAEYMFDWSGWAGQLVQMLAPVWLGDFVMRQAERNVFVKE